MNDSIKYLVIIVSAWLIGCGAIEDRVGEMIEDNIPPPITIVQIGDADGLPCPACPYGAGLIDLYPYDMADGTWVVAVESAEGCSAVQRASGVVRLWYIGDDGTSWNLYLTTWPVSHLGCINEMAVIGTYPHPAPAPWGGFDDTDIAIEVTLTWPNGITERAIQQAAGTYPGTP